METCNGNNTWMISVSHNCKISKLDCYSCLNEVHHQVHRSSFAASALSETIFLFSIKVFFSLDFAIYARKDLIVCQNVLLSEIFFSLRFANYFLNREML